LATAANVDTSENSAISAAKADSDVNRRVKYLALMKKKAEGILTETEAVELSNLSTALKGEGQSWVAPLEQAFEDNTNKVAEDYASALATAVNDAGVDIQTVEQYATEAF
jgi:hypothetical protein